jgi:16S rRNA (guanine966-N2)-methyltransferase
VQCAEALGWLARTAPGTAFDVVLVDPPYALELLEPVLQLLASRSLLAPDARIYVEHRGRDALPALPEGWRSVRDGRAGEVGYHLLAL